MLLSTDSFAESDLMSPAQHGTDSPTSKGIAINRREMHKRVRDASIYDVTVLHNRDQMCKWPQRAPVSRHVRAPGRRPRIF